MENEWAVLKPLVGKMEKRFLVIRTRGNLRVYNQNGERQIAMEDSLEESPELDNFEELFNHGWSFWDKQIGRISPEAIQMFKDEFNVEIES